jgi:hypothetical protein
MICEPPHASLAPLGDTASPSPQSGTGPEGLEGSCTIVELTCQAFSVIDSSFLKITFYKKVLDK